MKKIGILFESRQQLIRYVQYIHGSVSERESMDFPFYNYENVFCCVASSGSYVASAIEEYTVAGVECFVRIGTCGSIQPSVKIGDIVIPNSAIRGDEVSNYYLPFDYPAVCNENCYFVASMLSRVGECHIGNVYSAAARFRQDIEKLKRFAELGTLGIDMETAAFLSVSIAKKAKCIALLFVTDELLSNEKGITSSLILQRDVFPKMWKAIRLLTCDPEKWIR
jgi:uridine phosphorylase